MDGAASVAVDRLKEAAQGASDVQAQVQHASRPLSCVPSGQSRLLQLYLDEICRALTWAPAEIYRLYGPCRRSAGLRLLVATRDQCKPPPIGQQLPDESAVYFAPENVRQWLKSSIISVRCVRCCLLHNTSQ